MTAELHTRRSVLTTGAAVAGVAVGTVALAACGAGSDSGSSGGDAPKPGGKVIALADVPVGQAKSAKTPDGQDVIVAQPTAGTVNCFSAICTHQGCTVNPPQGAEIHCPCHGSVFDSLTGAVKNGPAEKPLPKVNVKVDNGQVVTA
ncbi:Rieske (2Fe-2S) protein [Amycolatopsis sp. NPDC004368]